MNGNYSAVAAKLKAIHGGGLKAVDYEELLSKSSVVDVYSYLVSQTGYKDVLTGLTDDQIHRTEIEKRLRHEMIREYSRIYNFMDNQQKKMLEFWFYRREIEFLKRGLRHLYNHETTKWIEDEDEFEEFFEKHTKLDCEKVKEATTMEQLVAACSNTPYASVLERSQNVKADDILVSMMLDSFYCLAAWRAKDKFLTGRDRMLFESIFGAEVDMHNILWLYRGKKYFDMSSEMLVTYLMPVRHKISGDVMKRMVAAKSAEEVVKITGETVYDGLFDRLDEGFFPEENMNRLYCRKAKSILTNEPCSMAAVFAYFELKEDEISNITMLIESIRYSLDKQTIRRHINIDGRENIGNN